MANTITPELRNLMPQGQGIEGLVNSGRNFTETDARNFAFAAGRQNEWQQFQNLTGAQALGRLAPATTPELNVNNLSSTTIPSNGQSQISDFISNIANSSMTNFEKAILELQKQRETLNTQQLDLAKTKREDALVGLEGAMNQGSSLDLFKKLRDEAGIADKESKLDSIMQQINDVKASYEAGKNALVDQSATMKLLTGKQARLADQANAQISNLSAAGALVQGQLDRAETLVGNYFKFAMDDRQAEIDRRKILFDLADKNLITLTDEEKDINNKSIAFLTDMNNRQLKEKDAITALMLDNPEAWQAAANKIDLTQPFEKIAKDLIPFIVAQNLKNKAGNGTGEILNTKGMSEMEKDAYELAKQGVYLENNLSGAPQAQRDKAFSTLVNSYVQEHGVDYETAKTSIIRMMQRIKGQEQTYNNNPASDFVTPPVTPPTDKTYSNSFGKGTFSTTSLTDRINELSRVFPNQTQLLRQELIRNGYNSKEVKKAVPERGVVGVFENLNNRFFNQQ